MITGYLDFFVSFLSSSIDWMNSVFITSGVSLLGFIMAVGILSILIGGLLIR